jgi:GxxExxY protein
VDRITETSYNGKHEVKSLRPFTQFDEQTQATIKGQKLDLLVENEVVVELKSQQIPPGTVLSQTISYLKATGLKRGLIINFGRDRLVDGIKRVSV